MSSTSSTNCHSLGSLLFMGFPERVEEIEDVVEFVKEHDTTLNFPQKLILMLTYVDNENKKGSNIDCISWTPNGQAFVIRDRKNLVKELLPLFSRGGGNKFSSFTRKLYRWGFRQISFPKKIDSSSKDRDLVFGHVYFQRDNKALISNLKSVTAAGTRRALSALKKGKKSREAVDLAVGEALPAETSNNMNTSSPVPESSFVGGRISSPGLEMKALQPSTSVLPHSPLSNVDSRVMTPSSFQPLPVSRQVSSRNTLTNPPNMSSLEAQIQYLKAIASALPPAVNHGSFGFASSSPSPAPPVLNKNVTISGDLQNLLASVTAIFAGTNNMAGASSGPHVIE